MRKHFSLKFFTKKGWNGFMPFLFLACLFSFIFWHLHNFSSMSNWIKSNSQLLWDLKHAEGYVLEMHNNFRGFILSGNTEFKREYAESKAKLDSVLEDLARHNVDNDLRQGVEGVQSDLEEWEAIAQQGFRENGKWLRGRGQEVIKSMRMRLQNMIEKELAERNLRRIEFETKGMQIYFWTSILMLILSIFFVRHFLRSRRWAQELQKSEEAYRQLVESATLSEQRFRGLLESAHDLILITDHAGKILYINHQVAQTFGYMREELIGQEIEILVPDQFKDLHIIQRQAYMRHPEARPMGKGMDLTGRKKDGSEIPLEISLSPFKAHGNLQIAAIIRDISERKLLEKRQQWLVEFGRMITSSLEPKSLMLSIGDFCLGKFADWCLVVPSSDDIALIKSQDKGEVPVIWEDGNELKEAFFKIVGNKKPRLHHNISQSDLRKLPFKYEELKTVLDLGIKSCIVAPLMGRDKVLGAIVFINRKKNYTREDLDFVQDVMGRASLSLDNARLYQISQQSLKMRDELLRIVSHDLKNPLNSIRLNAQVLEKHLQKVRGEDTILKRVKAMGKSNEHALMLINDLLDNAKMETGGLKLNKSELDLPGLLKETEEVFHSLAEEKGLELKVHSELKKHHVVLADHERIFQVVSNLLGNAIKYTPRGGHIDVSLWDNESNIFVSITDDGVGMSKEKQGHLFEKYWRDDDTGLHNLGLGLSIAKGVIEGHGGRIWVESEEGRGTSFCFSLPCAKEMGSSVLSLQ